MFFCTRPSIFYGNRAYMTYRANENVTPPSIKITNLRIISPLFCKILPKSTYLHVKRRYNINDKTLSSLYGHTITLITTCTLHNDVINVHVQTHAASPFFSSQTEPIFPWTITRVDTWSGGHFSNKFQTLFCPGLQCSFVTHIRLIMHTMSLCISPLKLVLGHTSRF